MLNKQIRSGVKMLQLFLLYLHYNDFITKVIHKKLLINEDKKNQF